MLRTTRASRSWTSRANDSRVPAMSSPRLAVPGDVSVTGFDGITVDGFAPYELTTLVQPAAEKGRAAGTIVTRMIEGLDAASISFTCTFRQGNTTGPPPG